jgi:hypothetical protein
MDQCESAPWPPSKRIPFEFCPKWLFHPFTPAFKGMRIALFQQEPDGNILKIRPFSGKKMRLMQAFFH